MEEFQQKDQFQIVILFVWILIGFEIISHYRCLAGMNAMGRRLVDLIIIQTVRCNIFAPRSIDVEIALMFLSLSTIESIDLTRFDLSFFLFFLLFSIGIRNEKKIMEYSVKMCRLRCSWRKEKNDIKVPYPWDKVESLK